MYAQDEFIRNIQGFKRRDAKAMEDIIDSFTPLIKKYSYWLDYDDAEQDLIVAFIEIIFAMPLRIISSDVRLSYARILSYIKKSMYRRYILLSVQKERKQNSETEYVDELEYDVPEDSAYNALLRDSASAQKYQN